MNFGTDPTPQDLMELAKSYITPELAKQAGIRRVDSAEGAMMFGRQLGKGSNYSGLVFPYFRLGEKKVREWRLRRDFPDFELLPSGKKKPKNKYLSPPGRPNMLYYPPGETVEMARNLKLPLFITEGEKKALALRRFCDEEKRPAFIIGLIGVYGWRGVIEKVKNDQGEWEKIKGVIEEMQSLPTEGRMTSIIFDANTLTNTGIREARMNLSLFLRRKKARVLYVDIPDLEGVNGIDDLLAEKGPEFVGQLFDQAIYQARTDGYKPVIDLAVTDLDVLTQQAWSAIELSNDPPKLFLNSRPSRFQYDGHEQAILAPINAPMLRYEMAKRALWTKEGKVSKPPKELAENMLEVEAVPLPKLDRIVSVPVFSPEGVLQTEEGYHASAKVYYAAQGIKVLDVPKKPRQKDVDDAISLLLGELLYDFPFVEPPKEKKKVSADRANAIGLLLLPFVRDMIDGPTPLHLIEAPAPGSGKGLLADALLWASVGRRMGTITAAGDDDEWRKQITTALIADGRFIVIDNIIKHLHSGALASALTSDIWNDRKLKTNEAAAIPVRCCWIATANNPMLSNEIARRTIRIRLDAKCDEPWKRSHFRHKDILGWATKNRPRLIWSAHVLIQNWVSAEMPQQNEYNIGSFENWARVIGGILDHNEIGGFLENSEEFHQESDTEQDTFRVFITRWWNLHSSNKVIPSEILPLAIKSGIPVRGRDEQAQTVSLGIILPRYRDKVVAFEDDKASRIEITLRRLEKPEDGYRKYFLEPSEGQ